MEGATPRKLLWARPPTTWPNPPDVMSYSVLTNIEECPHRWALGEATYEDVWSGQGYPRILQLASLSGMVVHGALQTILSALTHAGCTSQTSASAVTVMKELGGYTTILERAIAKLLARYANNPRVCHLIDHARRTLKTQTPHLRTQVQNFLSRATLTASPSVRRDLHSTSPIRERTALTTGAYTELAVFASAVGWKARLDLLSLTTEYCAITEYKTGVESEMHAFQVRLYALLWYRDNILNPHARLADKLVISYKSSDVSVPAPSAGELEIFEKTILDRTAAAKHAAALSPPPTHPHPDRCRQCQFRHMCATYWSDPVQGQLASKSDSARPFGDVEVEIQRTHGPSTWIANVQRGASHLVGHSVLVRSRIEGLSLAPDTRARLLDVHFRFPDVFEEMPTVTIGTLSEVFRCV